MRQACSDAGAPPPLTLPSPPSGGRGFFALWGRSVHKTMHYAIGLNIACAFGLLLAGAQRCGDGGIHG
jgi:hypothetical protein